MVCGIGVSGLLPYLLRVLFMKNPYQQIGKRVRVIRRQVGLTQSQLAEKADFSDNYIGLIERGEGQPTIQAINQIANALGVSLGELFLRDGEDMDGKHVLKELRQLLKRREPKDAQLILSISKRIFECFPTGKGQK